MDEYEEYDLSNFDVPELPDDLNYAMTQREIQKDIVKKWNLLKTALKDNKLNDLSMQYLEEFDKLLNYWL